MSAPDPDFSGITRYNLPPNFGGDVKCPVCGAKPHTLCHHVSRVNLAWLNLLVKG